MSHLLPQSLASLLQQRSKLFSTCSQFFLAFADAEHAESLSLDKSYIPNSVATLVTFDVQFELLTSTQALSPQYVCLLVGQAPTATRTVNLAIKPAVTTLVTIEATNPTREVSQACQYSLHKCEDIINIIAGDVLFCLQRLCDLAFKDTLDREDFG